MNLLSSHKFLVWGFLGVFGITATIGHTSGEASDLEALSGCRCPDQRVGDRAMSVGMATPKGLQRACVARPTWFIRDRGSTNWAVS